jgi:D-lactate dehydrogenase
MMKIAFFDAHSYDIESFQKEELAKLHQFTFLEPRLTAKTAGLSIAHDCVCSFVNDRIDRDTIEILSKNGIRLIALRCAGFNHVDLAAAKDWNISVVRVPEYSPHAVAEHAVTLILALNRKIHRAYSRVREGNFSLDGLVGFDLYGRTVGVVGTGRIGSAFAKIMLGFGCKVIAFDRSPNVELKSAGVTYVDLDTVFRQSDILSLHLPLTPDSHHLVNEKSLEKCKFGMMLINTSRGGLVDTAALIQSLKSGKVGFAGLDVYEEEEGVFFKNLSELILQDDQLARLLTFPNVLLTSHQAFLTENALKNIAQTTLKNIGDFEQGSKLIHEVRAETHTK